MFQSDDGEKYPEQGVGLTADISSKFADAAVRLLKRKRDKPFFLHVNFTAPHDPLIMPPGYESRYEPQGIPLPPSFQAEHPFDHGNFKGRDEVLLPWPRTPQDVREELAMYYRVISHMDDQLGRIFQALDDTGLRDSTIVIFTSDHGLAMGSHGLRGKQNMYEHTIGVPLILRGPGIPKGERFDAQVYLRDLYPTVGELTDVETPADLDSQSFLPVMAKKTKQIHPFVVGYFRDSQRMIRTDQWKYISYPQAEKQQLFDLKNDPFELRNLIDDPKHAGVAVELRGKLGNWLHTAGDPLAKPLHGSAN